MEKKIYLIFADSVDTVCEIKGYIRGTEEDAQAYCEDLNRANGGREKDFVFLELTQLVANQRWKTAMPAGFTTVTKTAERWGVSEAYVYYLCKEGRIPGVVFDKDHWCVPVDSEKPSVKQTRFLSARDMAKKWGIYEESVSWLCANGEIPGVERDGHIWRIPKEAENPLEGYVMISQLARQWGINRIQVSELCRDGRIPGVKRVGRNWYVPADAEKPLSLKTDRKTGYISATEKAKEWGTSRNFVCKACRNGRIPGAEYVNGVWHIPEDTQKPMNPATERLPGYISLMSAAEKWEVSRSFVFNAVKDGRIPGAECIDGRWHIPENAERPMDLRGKKRKK